MKDQVDHPRRVELVTRSVRVYSQAAEARVRHLRSFNGRQEIDPLIERDDGPSAPGAAATDLHYPESIP